MESRNPSTSRGRHSTLPGVRFPLLTQQIAQAGFVFRQTSFTTQDAAGRRLVMVRLQIRRENSSSPRVVKLGWLSVKAPHARYYSHENEDYIVFEPWSPGWESSLPLRCDGDVQHDGETIFDAIRPSDNISIAADNNVAGALALTVSFGNRSEAQIEMIVPYEGLPASMIRQSDCAKGRRSNCERRNDCSGFRSTKSMPAKPSDGALPSAGCGHPDARDSGE